jgi:hypothetical protein
VIVWLSFPDDGPLAHDGDLRRLGAGVSFLGGLLGLAAGRLRGRATRARRADAA